MEDNVLAIYYNNKECLELKEIENVDNQLIKDLPLEFFLEEEGFYFYENKIYHIQQEGLYRFINGKGEKCQYCFYKENIEILIASLVRCVNFCGQEKSLGHYDILNFYLQKDIIINLPVIKLVVNVLKEKAIPWRQGYIVSYDNEEAIDSFLEVWDISKQSWVLYLLNDYICLGNTNIDKTYLEVILDFMQKNIALEPIIVNTEVKHDFFSEQEWVKNMENIFANQEEKIKTFLHYKAFPVMKKGFASTKAFTSDEFVLKENQIYKVFLDGKEDLNYEIKFLAYGDLQEEFYGKKLYVFKGKTVKTF